MKQKIISKTTIEETLSQDVVCENIYNLCAALAALDGMEGDMYGEAKDKIDEARMNIINAIHLHSSYLITEPTV